MSTSHASSSAAKAPGRFIAVVGPSGAGKDSVMDGVCAHVPDLYRVRRVITRDPDAGGEAFCAVSDSDFAARVTAGAFALHWTAHGFSYGIPSAVHGILNDGHDVLANLSRGMLAAATGAFDNVIVLHVTASADVLAQRLALRGREQGDAIDRRLARPAPQPPKHLKVVTIDNSGPLEVSIATAVAALYPERG